MKQKVFLYISLLIPLMCSIAQERNVFFGEVSDNLGKLSRVHIININTKKGILSNDKGKFEILAKPTDSLRFSFVGYKIKKIVLSVLDFGINEKKIHLQKEVITLDEVNVKRHNLTGSIYSDSKLTKEKNNIDAVSLKLPNAGAYKMTQAERKIYTAVTSGGGFVPLELIINIISGRLKKLKKLKEIEETEKNIFYLKSLFTDYIIQDLQIDKSDVYRFIYYCESDKDYELAKNKGEFNVINFLKEKAVAFKKLNDTTKKP